jgi:hypothetical protein
MKCAYRGIGYVPQSSELPAIDQTMQGTYRGTAFRFKNSVRHSISTVPDAAHPLAYRGIAYLGSR